MVRTEVLAASVRDVRSVGRSFEYGADIVTMPPTVFEKMYNHILTDKGLELFQADYEAVSTSAQAFIFVKQACPGITTIV